MDLQLSFFLLAQSSLRNRWILAAFILLVAENGFILPPLFDNQLPEVSGLEKFKGSEDSAEHVTPDPHAIVDVLAVDDPQKDEMDINFIEFAGYFTENIRNYAEDVVAIDFVDLALLYQTVVVVNVRADPLLDGLKLSQDLLRPQPGDQLGQFVDGVEEMAFDLQLRVDVEERRGEDGCVVLYQLEIDSEGNSLLVDDGGEHGEEVPVVDSPDFLQNNVVDPFEVSWLLQGCVAHQPLLVGVETPVLEIDAPLIDQSFQMLFVGLFALWP